MPRALSLVCSRPSNVQWMGNFPVPQFPPLSMWTTPEPSCPQGHWGHTQNQVQRKGSTSTRHERTSILPHLGPHVSQSQQGNSEAGDLRGCTCQSSGARGKGTGARQPRPCCLVFPRRTPPEAAAALPAGVGLEHGARCGGVGLDTLKDFCFYSSIFRNL